MADVYRGELTRIFPFFFPPVLFADEIGRETRAFHSFFFKKYVTVRFPFFSFFDPLLSCAAAFFNSSFLPER